MKKHRVVALMISWRALLSPACRLLPRTKVATLDAC